MSSSPAPLLASEPFLRVLGRSLLFACGAMVLEVFGVLFGASARFAGLFEVQSGLLANLPAFVVVAFPLGLVVAVVETSLVALGTGRSVFSGVAFLSGIVVAYGVGGGRHLAGLGIRVAFAMSVGALLGGLAFAVHRRLQLLRQPSRLATYRAVLGGSLVLVLVINRSVLVRLYPAFHIALGSLEVVLLSLLAHTLRSPEKVWIAGWFVSGLGAALLVPAARTGARLDNFRFVVAERSELLGLGIQLGVRFAPSPPVDRSVLSRGLGARRIRAGSLDLRGRSILLITVDALRADHLGSYGYDRGTTPNLDVLAKRGTRFDAAYAATPHTSYSLTSLMTGKYMRPLLLQGAGADSETWPKLLQTYGYRTAAFYPPAVFFIDGELFAHFRDRRFDFEYAKVEFAEGKTRLGQFESYLAEAPPGKPLFTWVHLFGPHEPYVEGSRSFGPRDLDRYDSEIFDTDQAIGSLVGHMRARDPRALVIVSADHGEEFGEHGGRYHGTTVYEEQVRVPMLFEGEGIAAGRVVTEPVQTIDLLPTVLGALDVPIPPRLRGRDLRSVLNPASDAAAEPKTGLAVAETEEYTLLAEGDLRLICARRSAGCQLFNRKSDPTERRDLSRELPKEFAAMRERARALAASHGEYEAEGLRAEGKNLPPAILRGLAGDADAAPELARLLEDAEPTLRRQSAELLFVLGATEFAGAMRLALSREEDEEARAWLALGLTRTGTLAPLTIDLLTSESAKFRRFAALVLAEQGDYRGIDELVQWLRDRKELRFEDAKAIVGVLGRSRREEALPALLGVLSDVRLRPSVAAALGALGDKDATPRLLSAFSTERYATARGPLAEALFRLGATDELVAPLVRFLGVPDPMEGGLELALKAKLNKQVGGLADAELTKMRRLLSSGLTVEITVPPAPKTAGGSPQVRVVALVKGAEEAKLFIAPGTRTTVQDDESRYRNQPEMESGRALVLVVPPSSDWKQVSAVLPSSFRLRPGQRGAVDLLLTGPGEVRNLAFVPVREEIPPPAPKPWKPGVIQDED